MSDFSYRPALDGIRCIAVCSVVVYHLDRQWLPGGFLGVDVFFTLSGYLITTLLILERERHGRISVPEFWARRARRLLPASLLVVATVAVWLHWQPEFLQAARRGDLFASLGNIANWRLIATGQSYFEAFATAPPVRHFWSLAIEEQFYLIWPLTCALLLRSNKLRPLAVLCTSGAILSAIWCGMLFRAADPSRAYYGTDTRVHQLLIGAGLAVWFAYRRRTNRQIHVGQAAGIGTGLLMVAIWVVHDQWQGYYRGGSMVIAGVTALIIMGVESAPGSGVARLLGSRPAAAIGRGSYGLYLWHWPVFVFLPPGTLGLSAGLPISIARILVTVIITYVSYRFVEKPIRHPRTQRLRRPAFVVVGSLSGLVVIGILTLTMTWGARLPVWAGGQSPDRRTGQIGAANGNGPSLRVAVVGDSVAASLVPGLRDLAIDRKWLLFDGSEPGCPITMLPQVLDDGTTHPQNPICAAKVPALQREVVDFVPDVVIWHDLQSTLGLEVPKGDSVPIGSKAWAGRILDAWQRFLDTLRERGSRVIVVVPPLRSQDPLGGCGSTARCLDIQSQDARIRALTEEFLQRNVGDPGTRRLDLDPVLCPTGMPCPGKVDGVEVRLAGWDQTHFTEAGAKWIAPTLLAAIDDAALNQKL